MGTSWSDKHSQIRHKEKLPRHYCGSCTALRADDDALCLDCGRELPGAGWSPIAEAYDPFLGRVLSDRYVIDKIEGRGSSSTIYRAESLKVPKRFAIKMVKLGHSDKGVSEQLRTRLEREVRAIGMLRNPHIVRVYELLELDQNWIALVMDHIDGLTLEQVVERDGPLSVSRACALLRQVTNGLCEAHDVGMIHRDIKPANIMVERLPDGDDFAFLLDFGVVRLEDEAELTQGFLGTPVYASPEQALAAGLDYRSDIYSLGATFFYLLTGRAPFESDNTLEVLKAHVRATPPTLSEVRPEREFPQALEELVASMLAKSPQDRPRDLFTVIEWLEAVAQDRDVVHLASAPDESADLTNALGVEDTAALTRRTHTADATQTTSFADRPRTALGLKHLSRDRVGLTQDAGGSPSGEKPQRPRFDSSEVTAFHQTNPRGFERPPTNPGARQQPRDIQVKSTVQFLPEELAEIARGDAPEPQESSPDGAEQQAPKPDAATSGIPFARNIRTCAAASDDLIAFIDVHNEVWMVDDGALEPVCTPMERVTSVAPTNKGLFAALAGGTIVRIADDEPDFQTLFHDEQRRAIYSLTAPTDGMSLLASTADGTLFLGMLRRKHERWITLHANRAVVATAISPRGAMFAVASSEGFIRASTTESPAKAAAKFRVDAEVVDLCFSHDGHLLAVLLEDGRLPIFQVLYGRQISELSPDCPRPRSLFFSHQNILHGVCTDQGHIASHNLTLTERAAGE